MDRYEQYSFAALKRARDFGKARVAEAHDPGFGAQVAALDASVQGIETLAVKQGTEHGRTRRSTRDQEALKKRLRNRYMVPLRQVAKTLLPGVSGIDQEFMVPKIEASNVALLIAARSMAEHAETYRQIFVASGQPVEYVARLTAATDALEAAVATGAKSLGVRKGARTKLGTELKKARGIIVLLNTLVNARYEEDPDVLAEWRSAKRISPATSRADGNQTPAADSAPAGVIPTATPEVVVAA